MDRRLARLEEEIDVLLKCYLRITIMGFLGWICTFQAKGRRRRWRSSIQGRSICCGRLFRRRRMLGRGEGGEGIGSA